MSSIVRIERPAEGCASVVIDRPEKRNALNETGWRELGDAFLELGADPDVRAIILTGTSGAFCAGDDILAFASVRDNPPARQRYWDTIMRAYAAISDAPMPVIAAVDGPSVGGGCTIALRSDFRIAGPRAQFAVPPAKLGLVYPADSTALLVDAVGSGFAKYMLYTGNPVGAAEACARGLAMEAENGDAFATALQLATQMTGSAPLSVRAAKIACNGIALGQLDAITPEVQRLSDMADRSADYREGTAAFAEKRKPRFRGV